MTELEQNTDVVQPVEATEPTPVPYTEDEVRYAREAHEAKSAEDLAYDAGRHAANDNAARRNGIEACPFSEIEHPEERKAWLRGLGDELAETPDISALRAAVQEAHDA